MNVILLNNCKLSLPQFLKNVFRPMVGCRASPAKVTVYIQWRSFIFKRHIRQTLHFNKLIVSHVSDILPVAQALNPAKLHRFQIYNLSLFPFRKKIICLNDFFIYPFFIWIFTFLKLLFTVYFSYIYILNFCCITSFKTDEGEYHQSGIVINSVAD